MRTEGANFAVDGTAEDELLRAAFFEGYTAVTPLDEGYESRRPLYYLSRRLVHAGCMIELEGYGIEADRRSALAEIEKVLAGAPLDYRGNALLSHHEEPEGVDGEAAAADSALTAVERGGLEGIGEGTVNEIVGEVPTVEIERAKLEGDGVPILELFVTSGLCQWNGQARKELQGGGINLNNERQSDPKRVITASDLLFDRHLLLRKGKRNYPVITAT